MRMEERAEDQMGCPLCFLRNPVPWIAVLAVPLLVFAGFWGFGFLSILLTSSVLILSTLLFTSSKNKQLLVLQQVLIRPDLQERSAHNMEYVVPKPEVLESEATTQKKEAQDQVRDFLVSSPDTSSESECIDHSFTSEDSEVDDSPDCSDGSISDEESLFEIALPSGHYVGHSKKEEPKYFNQLPRKYPADFLPESFQQHSLMELLAEINDMNEEDNMIEIDLSMGSIKCSRFEIEA